MKHQLIAASLVIGLSTIFSQAASAAASVASVANVASADAGRLQPGEHDVTLIGHSNAVRLLTPSAIRRRCTS